MADIDPHVDPMDRTNGSGLNALDHTAIIVAGMDLGSHLGNQLILSSQITEHAGLMHCMGEGFFAVHMLAKAHRHGSGRCMRMVRCAYQHRIDFLGFLLEHDAEV